METHSKKIVLATGEYYPQLGGPAIYVHNLQRELNQRGYRTTVVTYGWEKSLPSGLRHVVFFLKLFLKSFGNGQIWAFDTYSVGLPSVCVGFLLRKNVLVRIGGDFLWEHYINRTQEKILLSEFYTKKPNLNFKERIIYKLTKYIVSHTTYVVFSTVWQQNIWKTPYVISGKKTFVIDNAYTRKPIFSDSIYGVFVSPARDSVVKNKKILREVMSEMHQTDSKVILDERSLAHEEHLKRIEDCYVVVIPSISEVSPNLLLDGLQSGKPFIVTTDCGFKDKFVDCGIFINPRDRNMLQCAIKKMLDVNKYEEYRKNIKHVDFTRSYKNVVDDFIKIAHVK